MLDITAECNQLMKTNSDIVNNEMLDITADFVKLRKVVDNVSFLFLHKFIRRSRKAANL